nr:hypothetical protein [Tanacetum cinerariifolium]
MRNLVPFELLMRGNNNTITFLMEVVICESEAMDHMITKTSTRSCDPFKHMLCVQDKEHVNQCRLYGELRFERWDHQCGCVFTFVHIIIGITKGARHFRSKVHYFREVIKYGDVKQLRIVLSVEDKLNYLEHHIPAALVPAQAGQQVAPEALAVHAAWEEGQSVSSYVLKMKSYRDNLECLGLPVTTGLGVSLILISLRKEFDGFVRNYNIHSMEKTINELHAILKLHEQTLPKNNAPAKGKVQKGNKKYKPQPQLAVKGQNQGKGKNKLAYASKPKIPPSPKREDPAKDSVYIRAIMILIAIAAFYDYEIWQMDVKLHSLMDISIYEEVYMEQPKGFVSQKLLNQNPSDLHWTTVKNILKYLRNTKDMFLVYEGVVDWKSAKQSIFDTSCAKAEYIAVFDASKEAVLVRKFIFGLGVVPKIEDPINNESGITKGAIHFRSKVHYIREVIKYGDVKLDKVHIDDNLADPFTKALAFPKHSEHTKNIGMLSASSLM